MWLKLRQYVHVAFIYFPSNQSLFSKCLSQSTQPELQIFVQSLVIFSSICVDTLVPVCLPTFENQTAFFFHFVQLLISTEDAAQLTLSAAENHKYTSLFFLFLPVCLFHTKVLGGPANVACLLDPFFPFSPPLQDFFYSRLIR